MGGRGETLTDEIRHGRLLAVAPDAQSAPPTEPAFVARPVPAHHDEVGPHRVLGVLKCTSTLPVQISGRVLSLLTRVGRRANRREPI
jgi:hypothetical protein